jgi:hypothetical protein
MLIFKSQDPDLELYVGRQVRVGSYIEGVLIRDKFGLAVKTITHTFSLSNLLNIEIIEEREE